MTALTNTADQRGGGDAIRSQGGSRVMRDGLGPGGDVEVDRRRLLGLLGAGAAASVGIPGAASAGEVPVVTVANNYFDPVGLYVEHGPTVRFEIEAGSYSATAYDGRVPTEGAPFDRGVISEGTFEYTFDVPGTYDYYCTSHRSMGMAGRVVGPNPAARRRRVPLPTVTSQRAK